jgi:hypothetical protein
MPHGPDLNRRELLRTATGLAAALALSPARAEPADAGRIRRENEHPGSRDWMATNVRIDPKTKYRSPGVEGFASKTSVRPGESIALHVSTNPASPFAIDVYRMGYYQGHGARHLLRLGPFKGAVQPDPPVGEMRLRECAWEPCTTLTIPEDWTSGVYLGKLTAEREGVQSYVVFVVRDDRKADFLFQVSDNTWNAYNRWPSQFSLYDDGKKVWYWGPNVKTSFDRPYGKYCQILDAPLSVGSGEFLLWEFPLAYWMEKEGYDVSYISNTDTHADPKGLSRARAFLSVGHDEYWSLEMFRNVKQAVADGLNVAFLSGNSICGVTPLLPSTDGRPNRVITRVGRYGSPQKEELEHGFEEEALFTQNGPNEATLIGARSTYPVTGGADWTCRKPDHWLFAGTGMKEGDGIPGLVGWEWHGDPAPIPGLEVVASGKAKSPRGEGTYTATLYPGPKGNLVFNAATIWWADGLSEPPGYVRPSVYTIPKGPDPRVQRITRNLLERFRQS